MAAKLLEKKKFVKSNSLGDTRQLDGHDSQLYKSIEWIGSHDRQPANKVLHITPKLIDSCGRQLTDDDRQFGSHRIANSKEHQNDLINNQTKSCLL